MVTAAILMNRRNYSKSRTGDFITTRQDTVPQCVVGKQLGYWCI